MTTPIKPPFYTSHIVPPSGNSNAKILFIGEAPRLDEHISRKPFMGASGRLLNFCLLRAGIFRDSCYFDNVIQEQPYRNILSKFITITTQGGVKRTPKYDIYEELLAEKISKLNPNVIVAVGNIALYALTGILPPKITSRRGSVYPYQFDPTIKVIGILPIASGILGDTLATQLTIWDLKKIRREAESKEFHLPNPDLIIAPTFKQVMAYLLNCKNSNYITFDIEGRETVNCISFCCSAEHAISIPFINEENELYFTLEEEWEIWKLIADILEDPNITVCNQNINYDASVLYRLYGIIINSMEDTGIAQNVLYPDFPKRLEFVTNMWTNYNYYKEEGHEYIKTGTISDFSMFWHYSAMDAIVPFIAFPEQLKALKKQNNLETYKRQRGSLDAVLFMQAKGIRVDKEGVKSRAVELKNELATLLKEFQAKAGEVTFTKQLKAGPVTKTNIVNPSSTDDMRAYFYGKLGIRPYLLKGKPTLGEKALRKIIAAGKKGVIEAKLAINIRSTKTILSNYFTLHKGHKHLLDPEDQRIRCSFNLAGTSSGRWSSSAFLFNIGRNLHNLPKKAESDEENPFRKFLLADKGMLLCRADLSMAENRIVAYIAPELKMIAALEKNLDLYKFAYGQMFNVPMEEVTNYQRNTKGKPYALSANYGIGPGKISEQYGIPFAEAKQNLSKYLQTFRGIPRYQAWVTACLKKNRTLINCYGRKRIFYSRLHAGDEQGVNAFYFIPQSTVGDIINQEAVQEVYNKQNIYKDVELLLQVHDEIDFQFPLNMPIEKQWEILCTLKKSMEVELSWKDRKFTIPADFEFGFNLWEMQEVEWEFNSYEKLVWQN